MLYHDRIDVNKTSKSKECHVCHYWNFWDKGFKAFNKCLNKLRLQTNVYNESHDLLMMSMNTRDIAILNIKSADYCCIISRTS